MKIIILEGADNVGKTSICQALNEYLSKDFNVFKIRQPSSSNIVPFIRDLVKNNEYLNNFERQLLHTISHIADLQLLTELIYNNSNYDYIIMDRSYISNYIYTQELSLYSEQKEILKKCNMDVYKRFFKDYNIQYFEICLTTDKPYGDDFNDVYKSLNWDNLNKKYIEYFNKNNLPIIYNRNVEDTVVKILEIINK